MKIKKKNYFIKNLKYLIGISAFFIILFAFFSTKLAQEFSYSFLTSIGLISPVSEEPSSNFIEGAKISKNNYVPDELLIRFKPGLDREKEKKILTDHKLKEKEEIKQIGVKVVSVKPDILQKIEKMLAKNPNVDFVEKNRIAEITLTPNDPKYGQQWHLPNIQAPQSWDISTGDPNVKITICDTGIEKTHSDLADKILSGWNFVSNNDDVTDVFGHGTKVAGTAAAITNNNLGVAGVSWDSRIIPGKVGRDSDGWATWSALANCVIFGADKGAKVANMSYGVVGSSTISSAGKYMMDKGGLAVASAGNSGTLENYPDNPYIIFAAATGSNNLRASFSSYGPFVDLAAPGSGILTTTTGGGYSSVSGTSFSAPITAGVAALIFAANPSLTPNQVEQILKSTALDLGDSGYDMYYGWGRVDAAKALLAAASTPPPPVDNIPPTVSIAYPNNNEEVKGVVEVRVSASDNEAVSKVELYINDSLFATDNSSPYNFIWDTTLIQNGTYKLYAKAYDKNGNSATSDTIAITVANVPDITPPNVTITNPKDGSVLSGNTVKITTNATDPSGIQYIKIYIDSKLVKTCVDAASCAFNWSLKKVAKGSYIITAEAADKANNVNKVLIVVSK